MFLLKFDDLRLGLDRRRLTKRQTLDYLYVQGCNQTKNKTFLTSLLFYIEPRFNYFWT